MNPQPPSEKSVNTGERRSLAVLIVDDSGVALESLGNFITCQPGLRVSAVATSGLAALKQLARITVDLVLVDLNMPGMDGSELSRRIKALPSLPRVIVTSVQTSAAWREAAEEAGADGFVAKSDMGTSFMPLVNRLFPS